MPTDSQPSSSNQMTQGLESGHQPDSSATQPLTPGGALTPGAISAAVKTELNLIPKAEIDSINSFRKNKKERKSKVIDGI